MMMLLPVGPWHVVKLLPPALYNDGDVEPQYKTDRDETGVAITVDDHTLELPENKIK
jgi:hypothetical protein